MEEKTPRKSATCPHLGIADDPSTSHNFPSIWNYCFHSQPPVSPNFQHQETTCLTEGYVSCPVYLAAKGSAFPAELRNKNKPLAQASQKSNRVYAFIAGAVLLVALAGWWISATFINLPTSDATPASLIAGETQVVAMTKTAALETTDSPQPTITTATSNDPIIPTSTSWVPAVGENDTPAPYTLEVPFQIGGDDFIIHQVKAGEGLDYLAKIHNTTPEVIREINYAISLPIWTDRFIVIRPGKINIEPSEPSFQPYQVIDGTITIDKLAQKLQVDLAALKYYNACTDVCTFVMGDWVLVARQQ